MKMSDVREVIESVLARESSVISPDDVGTLTDVLVKELEKRETE